MIYTYQDLLMWFVNVVTWRFLIPAVVAIGFGTVYFGFLKSAKRKGANP